MSLTTDLKMAYHMGYDDALAKRKPDASKVHMLGRGECRLDGYTDAMFRVCSGPEGTDFIDYAGVCECSACGASVIVPHEYERVTAGSDELWPKFNYCPNCGRRIVGPTTNDADAEVDA